MNWQQAVAVALALFSLVLAALAIALMYYGSAGAYP